LNYDNVKLWFARDENNEIITIDQVNEDNRHSKYLCPMCNSQLQPKAIKSTQVSSHFAHFDVSKCTAETMIHWWFKNKFIEPGDKFKVASDKEREYICKEIFVEQGYEVGDKTYRPDVTVTTECGSTIYFEMDYSNKKKVKDYIDIWLELKNIVVEVDVKKMVLRDKVPTFKALFYDGKCFNVKSGDVYYSIIGRYKEGKLQGVIDEELKERIRNLDWFWEDVVRYNQKEVDIEHLVNALEYVDDEEAEVVAVILHKLKCSLIYKDYINKKSSIIHKSIVERFDKLYSDLSYEITTYCPEKSYSVRNPSPQICFKDLKERCYHSYNMHRNSMQKISNLIEDQLKAIFKREEKIKDMYHLRSNKFIESAVKIINGRYQQIDANYSFYSRFSYIQNVCLNYNGKTRIDFELPKYIIYSEDEADIINFLECGLHVYMNNVKPFKTTQFLIAAIDKINADYSKIIFQKEKEEYLTKTDRGYWKTKNRINEVKYELCYKFCAQDIVEIELNKKAGTTTAIIGCLTVNKKGLYSSTKHTFFKDEPLKEDFKKIVDEEDFDDIEAKLRCVINEIIKDKSDFICADCREKFEIKIGEMEFFITKGFNLPHRCLKCRKLNKKKHV